MQFKTNFVSDLRFLVLYPPDGCSNLIEVSDEEIGDFLYVRLGQDGCLIYEFFNDAPFSMTAKQLREIENFAQENLYRTSNP